METVLVQLFERRVLTYLINQPNAKVEMGNVGQHYYQWRYPPNAILEFGKYYTGLKDPTAITTDKDGNIFVFVQGFHHINKYDPLGNLITIFGEYGTGKNKFDTVTDLVTDAQGNLYTVDSVNHLVQKFSNSGEFLLAWGSFGTNDAQFQKPSGIGVDASGTVYVVDQTSRVQTFDPNGNFLSKWGEKGQIQPFVTALEVDALGNVYILDYGYISPTEGFTRAAKFSASGQLLLVTKFPTAFSLYDLTVDLEGNYYLIEALLYIVKYDPQGNLVFKQPVKENFNIANAITLDKQNNIYVTRQGTDFIAKFDREGQPLFSFGDYNSPPGFIRLAQALTFDAENNLFITDTYNRRIHKFSQNGRYLQLTWGSFGNNEGQFLYPYGITTDKEGNIYVADRDSTDYGDADRLHKFDKTGKLISQLKLAYSDKPNGIAIDKQNHLLVPIDYGNRGVLIYDLDLKLKGTITSAANYRIGVARAVAVDSHGNIYVLDQAFSHIAKFDSNYRFLRYLGAKGRADGQFENPVALAIDAKDNLYIVDQALNRLQKMDSNGIFLAKFGTFGYAKGQFNRPSAIAIDQQGYLYITDQNDRVQKIPPL